MLPRIDVQASKTNHFTISNIKYWLYFQLEYHRPKVNEVQVLDWVTKLILHKYDYEENLRFYIIDIYNQHDSK
jgi:hypothetical protein